MTTDDALRSAIIDVLGTSASTPTEIARQLVDGGVVPGPAASAERRARGLFQRDTSFAEVSGGVMYVPAVMDGTVWTVWVDPDDAAEDFVRMLPQLSPLIWWMIEEDLDLLDASGAVVGELTVDDVWLDDRDLDVVRGPHGWLDDLAGGWASVAVVGGALRWTVSAAPPAPSARQADAVRAGFERSAFTEQLEMFDDAPLELRLAHDAEPINEALMIDREAFLSEPIAPSADLYRAAGLEEHAGFVAEAGFDWTLLTRWQNRNRLGGQYGLTSRQVELLVVLAGAFQTYAADGAAGLGANDDERDGAAVLLSAVLEDGDLASAFWRECRRMGYPPEVIGEFAAELAARFEDDAFVGVGWLRARCLDLAGDSGAAAELAARLVAGRCEHLPLLVDAAGFLSDRGDAVAAYRLLQRASELDDQVLDDEAFDDWDGTVADERDVAWLLRREIEGFALHRPKASVGRNEPCPCGSGRKYKACHLGKERHSLADRSAWLSGKAVRFLRTRHTDRVRSLASDMAAYEPRLFGELVSSPFVDDLALHEGGVFDEFLAARHTLLPDDEALLASQWALVDRGVFEILRISGDRLELHDIGRGEDVVVVNTNPSPASRPGTVMVGRPLPVGDTFRAFGGFMGIHRGAVSDMLDSIASGDAEQIASVLAGLFRPPRLQNTDGDDLEFHTLRWRVPQPAAVGGLLGEAGFAQDGDELRWRLERADSASQGTIVATVTLVGEELVGEVNSAARSVMLRDLVASALPGSSLVDEQVRSMDDLDDLDHPHDRDDGELAAGLGARPSLDEPAVRDALAAFVAEHERRWIDEAIPALGGRTPRDAMTDPVGREQLLQLLDSFPVPDDDEVGMMNPMRIRSLLGL